MPTFPQETFTDNQSVNPAFSTADDTKLLKLIADCVSASESYRNQFAVMTDSWIQDATKYEALYNGKLYDKRQKMSYECKEDIYRDMVDFNASLLSQFEFKEEILQVGKEDNSLDADLFMRFIEFSDNENDASAKEEDLLKIEGQMGIGIYKFKPFEQDGYWWPGAEVVDPRQCGISPGASSIKDAVYFYWRRPVPTSELKEKFPDVADSIKPDAELTDMEGKPNGSRGIISVEYLATGGIQNMMNMFQGLNRSPKLQTMMTEFYYKDPEVITISSQEELMAWFASNPGFGTEKYSSVTLKQFELKLGDGPIKVKKFPFGRMILSTKDVKLDDTANPYYRIPFFSSKCYSRPKTFWAKGVCEVIREPVQNYHLLMASLAMNLDYLLRPAYQESGVKGNESKAKVITTQPNSMMSTSGEIKPIPVPSAQPSGVIELAEIRRRNWENTSGLNSVSAGVNPVGNYSGAQLEKLIEGAMGKVAPRLRELNRCRKELGEMKLWFSQNYCTDERKINFMTDEEIQEVTVNQYTMNGGAPTIQNDMAVGCYKYVVDVDVKRPVTQAARNEQYINLSKIFAPYAPAEAGTIQIESMNIPNKRQYIKQFQQAVAQKQQSELQIKQQQLQIQQKQAEMQNEAQHRKMDIEEIKAGASAEESASWVIANLSKAGIPLTPEFLNQLNVQSASMTQMAMEKPELAKPEPQDQGGQNAGAS